MTAKVACSGLVILVLATLLLWGDSGAAPDELATMGEDRATRIQTLRCRITDYKSKIFLETENADSMRASQLSLMTPIHKARMELRRQQPAHVERGLLMDLVSTLESQLHIAGQETLSLRRALSMSGMAIFHAEEVIKYQAGCLSDLGYPGDNE